MSDHPTHQLSDYVDGDLAEPDRAALESHLAACPECRRTLAELNAVVRHAGALAATEPAHDLWPGILERIRGEDVRVIPISTAVAEPVAASGSSADRNPAPSTKRGRVTLSWPQLAAAAGLVAFLSGGSVWLALRTGAATEPLFVAEPPPAAVPAGTTPVQLASLRGYDAAIQQLEQELEAARARLDPETVAIIEHNLEVIDAAIAEARQAIARDPANTFLYRHLDNTLMKKIEILRRVTTLSGGPA